MAIEPFLGTRAQRGFLFTVVGQGLIVIAMVGASFGLVERIVDVSAAEAVGNARYRTLPTYLALFGFAELFELIIAIDAIRLRNVIELIGILCFQVALLVFSILFIPQTKKALVTSGEICDGSNYATCDGPGSLYNMVEKFLIVCPIVIGLSLFVMSYFVHLLYGEFGWAVFHAIGADPKKKRMFRWYQIMIVLLKFDFFCFAGLSMELLILILARSDSEFGLTIAAIPIVLLLLVLCAIAVQREIKWLMTISLILMLGAQTYFIYKLVRIFQPSNDQIYQYDRGTLATFSIVALDMVLCSFLVGLRVFADFGKGLREAKTNEAMSQARPEAPKMGEKHGSTFLGSQLERRMSIE